MFCVRTDGARLRDGVLEPGTRRVEDSELSFEHEAEVSCAVDEPAREDERERKETLAKGGWSSSATAAAPVKVKEL